MTTDATHTAAAAATTLLPKQLIAAKPAVTQATTHLELMRAIAEQACVVADKVTWCQVTAQEALMAACRARAAAIDTINITINNEAQCVVELNAIDMDDWETTKSQLANGVQSLVNVVVRTQEGAVNALNIIHKRTASANATEESGSVGTQGMTAMPRSSLTISTTTTVAMVVVTPLLYEETALAIRKLNPSPASKDTSMTTIDFMAPTIGGHTIIIKGLKTLLDDGIISCPCGFSTPASLTTSKTVAS